MAMSPARGPPRAVQTSTVVVGRIRESEVVSTQEFEKMALPKPVTIGTHDGTFHCDEALAIAMLKCLEDYEDAVIIRTRDAAVLGTCDVVCDVGAVYDPLLGRFDHHQRGFDEKLTKTKLSSAGLIWRHYGYDVLAALGHPSAIYERVYERFVEHIDGIDNGVEAFGGTSTLKNYEVSTTLPARVGRLNLRWNEDARATAEVNARFKRAVELCATELFEALDDAARSWLPARRIVFAAFEDRFNETSMTPRQRDHRLLLLDTYCPFVSHVFDLETRLQSQQQQQQQQQRQQYQTQQNQRTNADDDDDDAQRNDATKHRSEKKDQQQREQAPKKKTKDAPQAERTLYVVFPDSQGTSWRVQAVPVAEGSFTPRLPLPEPWRGLRDTQLADVSGVATAIFVHQSGFVAGTQTRDDAILLAQKALAHDDDAKPATRDEPRRKKVCAGLGDGADEDDDVDNDVTGHKGSLFHDDKKQKPPKEKNLFLGGNTAAASLLVAAAARFEAAIPRPPPPSTGDGSSDTD